MKQDDFYTSLKTIKKHLAEKEEDKIIEAEQKHEKKELFCSCKDTHGNQKNLYLSYREAHEENKYLHETQRISLTIYPCPFERGWHLTKG